MCLRRHFLEMQLFRLLSRSVAEPREVQVYMVFIRLILAVSRAVCIATRPAAVEVNIDFSCLFFRVCSHSCLSFDIGAVKSPAVGFPAWPVMSAARRRAQVSSDAGSWQRFRCKELLLRFGAIRPGLERQAYTLSKQS